ncbi:MAG TPA: SDR family oxidoreductase [Bryobacteraceae bacterium]|nr:SDR family oxidoreductase [Bryobacteraceae bacterium]
MNQTLNGLEIVLAGGSGGLGSATCRLLAAEGARLTVSYYAGVERAQKLAGLAEILQADLVNPEHRVRILNAAPNIYGLVIFAGDPARVKNAADFETMALRSQEINYLAPMMLARETAARMQASKMEGSIVLFSTMQAVHLFPGSTVYAAAKASLQHAARILAKEFRQTNIRVNVIAPGVTNAGMAEASIAAGKYDHFLSSGIVHRFGRAADVARAVRFLLEPDNYITGQILSVDGGATL